MRVGLVDVDGHNYPNYALMKISAWHKERGDSVEWADSNPNPEMIKRVFLYALQNTNILLADDWDEVRWNLLIKKAMEE